MFVILGGKWQQEATLCVSVDTWTGGARDRTSNPGPIHNQVVVVMFVVTCLYPNFLLFSSLHVNSYCYYLM